MKIFALVLCVSCVPIGAQNLLSTPRFSEQAQTVTYYQLSHAPGRRVRKLLDEAAEKLRERDYDSAISLFRSALARDRGSWEAHMNLGAAYFWGGDRRSAQAEFQTAMSLDPENALSYADLAVCALREGRVVPAASFAKQALRLDPQSRLAQRVLEVTSATTSATTAR